ncbi:HNH endonuclease [Fluviispira multicolorata]|uniref:HNH endonuclease n=1 Tax=Fluviispira multicolorata TaxID=2654512 RepID=A0A833JFR2_9BACT|nr:HNH endonuclease [Fluviispira multicolorata]KAB8031797.1 HNH endonuclease [Fluviispira multicolorata]
MNLNSYIFADEEHIKREKAKVKAAKKSRWWQQKCAPGLCAYCGKKFPIKELTLDHIVPLARGGTTAPGNVVPACRECNKNKGVDTPVDLIFKKL